MNAIDLQLANFRHVDGRVPEWVRQMRATALGRFAELGFPTTRLEEWKYTNVAPLVQVPFELPSPPTPHGPAAELARRSRLGVGSELVFVNGRYVAELSVPGSLPAGAQIGSLAAILETHPALVEPHLGRYAGHDAESFTALNTAFITDGAIVYLPKGAVLSEPIHLVFLSTASAAPTISHPRTLIIANESSQATVIESYVGGEGTYCTNAVTEIVVGPNATLTHYKLQRENESAFHIGRVEAHQARDSQFASHAVSLGGALTRTDINTTMAAEGAACTLDGLYLTGGRQHVDHHTSIDHQKPHCTSRELYKGVLDGRSSGVFNGKVFVRPQAQKSDAGQMNKNLLLSESAVIDTKPQLEIFADDVKCSHGATIGRLDEDAIFYLRARGIGAATARNLLIYAFANELIGRMKVEPVRVQLDRVLWSRFHTGINGEASA